MTISTLASLQAPNPPFMHGNGRHTGVWKRKKVTSCWSGKLVILETVEEAHGTCCCEIIRVGDVFAVARTPGDPAKVLRDYQVYTGARAEWRG